MEKKFATNDDGKQMMFTEDEIALLKQVFKDNDALVKLLRKFFLPTMDPDAPVGQMVDLWMQKDYSQMTPEEVKVAMMARRDLIMHVESVLLTITILSEKGELSPLQIAEKKKKDSAK